MGPSADVVASWKSVARQLGCTIDTHAFYRLFFQWMAAGETLRIPKSVVAAFERGDDGEHAAIAGLIDQRRAADEHRLHDRLFALRKRLADAGGPSPRGSRKAPSKAAAVALQAARDDLALVRQQLEDLQRIDPRADDGRFFPGWIVPVIVVEEGRRLVRPMRFQPAPNNDSPGGQRRGIVLLASTLAGQASMLVPCVWAPPADAGGPEWPTFTLVTETAPADGPEPGPDGCVVALTPAEVDAWLDANR